jgi:hypothetical protein
MSDTLTLKRILESFDKYVLTPSRAELPDLPPELISRMSFIAGAQAVVACLEMDRTPERFSRMLEEAQAFRMEVGQMLELYKLKSKGKGN